MHIAANGPSLTTKVVPAIEKMAGRRTGLVVMVPQFAVVAHHMLVSRFAGYNVDLMPDLRGCLSRVSMSVLIFACHQRLCLLHRVHEYAERGEDVCRWQ